MVRGVDNTLAGKCGMKIGDKNVLQAASSRVSFDILQFTIETLPIAIVG